MSDIETLYKKRDKIYPRRVKGLFANLRIIAVLALMGIYYLVPWINWGDRQVILYDLPHRKFYFFDAVIWPQDFIYLTLLLVIAALTLFFFTNLFGRVWCGYACPQTVWTEISMWIERMVIGDRPKQIKLSKMPWNLYKIRKVSTQYIIWASFALWTGFTFVGWFSPIRELFISVLNFNISSTETFWMLFYSFATWGMAGLLREQVCFYMCPYARFQSVMFDQDTLIISYDYNRGEPRGRLSKGKIAENNGDCVDCDLCVQACPTGIDIRKGLQYECIACAACIDACDRVMDKIGQPRGLIRYTTENSLLGKPSKILRPRAIMYGIVLLVATLSLVYAVYNRLPMEMNIIRDRASLFQEDYDGNIVNDYTIKMMNMDSKPHFFNLSVHSDEIADIKLLTESTRYRIKSGEIIEIPLSIVIPPELIKKRSNEILLTLASEDNPELKIIEPARFLGPRITKE